MTGRIERRFAALQKENRAALVTFTMAGDPDHATAVAILKALPKAGADIIELGMPFTDPMADGPAIQAAGLRALKAGANMKKTLAAVREFRAGDAATPLVLMGYYNPIYVYGVDTFLADAKAAGVDGLIVVDLPPEEDAELCLPALQAGINFIRLATPTTDDKRLPTVLTNTSGFVYYVSITGITGAAAPDTGKVGAAVARIKRHTKLPVCVGFGVRSAEQARAIAQSADGVVVGSALVEAVRMSLGPDGKSASDTVAAVTGLVSALAEGVRSALAGSRLALPLQFIERDRQIAHPLAGGVIDGIGDCRGDADDADLADALDAERIDDVVRLVDENHLYVVNVGVHRDMVFGDIGVHDAPECMIDQRLLVQRHADAADDGAHDLAVRGLGIEDAAGGDRADDAGDTDHADLLVDLHFGEHGGMRVLRVFLVFLEIGLGFPLDAVKAAMAHGVGDQHGLLGRFLVDDLAVDERGIFKLCGCQR